MIKSMCLFAIGVLMSGNLLLRNNTPVVEVPLQPINEEVQIINEVVQAINEETEVTIEEVETVWVCPYGNTECLNGVNCNNSCYNGNNDSSQGNMNGSNGKNCYNANNCQNRENNQQNQRGQHHRR